jgi:hypothetical protein
VRFGSEVVEHAELKEIIDKAVRETMANVSEKQYFNRKRITQDFQGRDEDRSRRRYSENDEPIYKI